MFKIRIEILISNYEYNNDNYLSIYSANDDTKSFIWSRVSFNLFYEITEIEQKVSALMFPENSTSDSFDLDYSSMTSNDYWLYIS